MMSGSFGLAIPLLASSQGGVAERSIKSREASADREAGVVFRLRTTRKTTPSASVSVASRLLLMTQPPLLAVMQGRDCAAPIRRGIFPHLHDPALQLTKIKAVYPLRVFLSTKIKRHISARVV